MPQEITKRHAIIEALRANRTAKEIIDFFNYNKDLVYRIKKQFEACNDPETFIGERKTHKRRSDAIRIPEFVTKEDPGQPLQVHGCLGLRNKRQQVHNLQDS